MNAKSLRRALKKLASDTEWSNELVDYYSVDCSSYQVKPKVVVFPKSIKEIVSIIKFANRHKISVVARGGGTGLVGSALGEEIILDLKKLDKISKAKNHVTTYAGVRKGCLDKILVKDRRFFGPNPSVGPYCTVGGMIATNASGSRSLKYGSVIDNLLEVTIITGSGKIVKLPSKDSLAVFVANIASKIKKKSFPNVSKNSCGYRLDAIKNHKESQKIIAASEGTLGIIVSAKLKTFPEPKKRILLVLGYKTPKNAALDCFNITRLNPSAAEFVDYSTLKNFGVNFPKKIRCLLFVEFDSDIKSSVSRLKKMLKRGTILYCFDKNSDMKKWWKFRDSALYYSIKNILPDESMPHIIEDATVPLDNLPKLFILANTITKKIKGHAIMYGHAGNGNIHIRLISKSKNKKMIKNVAKWFFSNVIKLGGTITGEHGDGLARSEFVKMQYDKKTYLQFLKLKKQFDPVGILNPDKKITKKSLITENIRL